MPFDLLLLRHGETEWSQAGRHTGRTDLPLLDAGRAQAKALAEGFAKLSPAAVWVSPLQRARQTAAAAGLSPTAVDPDLQEWDYGRYEGRTSAEIDAAHPGWSLWDEGCPGGETPNDVGARCDRVLARAAAGDGTVVLVGHGHCLRVLVARWLGLPPGHGRFWVLSPASLTRLGREHDRPVISHLNRLSF